MLTSVMHRLEGLALVGAIILVIGIAPGIAGAAKSAPQPKAPPTVGLEKAKTALATDQAAATAADRQLADLTVKLRQDFEATPDMAAALADQIKAQTNYELALGAVRETLMSKDEYKKALEADKAAKDAEKALEKPGGGAAPDQLAAVAAARMAAASAIVHLELAALDVSPASKEARAKYEAAAGKVAALRAVFDRALQEDQAYAATKAAAEKAHAQADAAQKALDAAYDNHNQALAKYADKVAAWAK